MSTFMRSLGWAMAGLLALSGPVSQAAPPVKVDLATPASGEQGTIDLDVTITGSGFEPGAAVDFFVTGGETDKGNVVVKQVIYNDSKKLTAKVSLQNAKLSNFDVKVTLASGRNGKGISLFKVTASSSDSVPPGSLGNLTAVPGIRGLMLNFTSTGDDGDQGTASAYRTRVVSGACPANDSSLPEWTTSTHNPLAPGRLDAIRFSPLSAGSPYCLQIRVLDDVGLSWTSPWIEATTLPGNWTLTALPTTISTIGIDGGVGLLDSTTTDDGAVLVAQLQRQSGGGVTGLLLMRIYPHSSAPPPMSFDAYDALLAPTFSSAPASNDCALSPGDCVVQIAATDPLLSSRLTSIDTWSYPVIAADVGIVGTIVTGTWTSGGSTTWRTVLLERRATGGWTSEVLAHRPSSMDTAVSWSGPLTYVGGSPVYTWVRDDSTETRTLMISERNATNGQWTDTALFSRTRASRKAQSRIFFTVAQRDADGRLKVFVAPDSSNNGVYLVRKLSANEAAGDYASCPGSQWLHYFTPTLDAGSDGYATGLDSSGHLMVAAEPLPQPPLKILLAREGAQFMGPNCGTGLTTAGSVHNTSSSTWTNIDSEIPGSWANATGPISSGPTGIFDASGCGGVQIGIDMQVGFGAEQQLLSYDGTGAHTQRVNHVHFLQGPFQLLASGSSLGEGVAIYPVYEGANSEYLVFERGPACQQ